MRRWGRRAPGGGVDRLRREVEKFYVASSAPRTSRLRQSPSLVKKSKSSKQSSPAVSGVAAPPKAGVRGNGRRPTIYDLARIANVSPGTVSRVLNNRNRVKAETREAVLRAAAELNLKPQASVRNREVAILSEPSYPDRFGGYAATLTAHLSFAFSQRDIGVLLPSDPLAELPTKFLDGIVVVTQDQTLAKLVAELETRIPVVHLDKFQAAPGEYVICSDHFAAGYLAGRHFVERGKRRPAFVGGNYAAFAERLKGFKKALAEANLPVDGPELSLYDVSNNYMMSVITRIVRAGADAIYAPGSSYEALECLHMLTYVMGLKVPQDIALIGGENERVSALLSPPMTTIEEPLRDMADAVVEMLDALTKGERPPQPRIVLPVRLIERNSV